MCRRVPKSPDVAWNFFITANIAVAKRRGTERKEGVFLKGSNGVVPFFSFPETYNNLSEGDIESDAEGGEGKGEIPRKERKKLRVSIGKIAGRYVRVGANAELKFVVDFHGVEVGDGGGEGRRGEGGKGQKDLRYPSEDDGEFFDSGESGLGVGGIEIGNGISSPPAARHDDRSRELTC